MLINWLLRIIGRKRSYRNAGNEKICGTVPSPKDKRDWISALPVASDDLPDEFILPGTPETKHQGSLGSCYAFAIASAHEHMNRIKRNRPLNLSELFLWFNTRIKDQPGSGGYIREALEYARKHGIAMEVSWPYDTDKWNDQPGWGSYYGARFFRIKSYHRVNGIAEAKKALHGGYPVIFGMKVHADRLNAPDGVILAPKGKEIGGHAMYLYGWNSIGLLDQNSWGPSWGKLGRAVLPYDQWEHVFEAWRIEIY